VIVLMKKTPSRRRDVAHFLDRRDLSALCGLVAKPEVWEVVVIRPSTERVCPECWERRYEGNKVD
jgi:hypothetical protein